MKYNFEDNAYMLRQYVEQQMKAVHSAYRIGQTKTVQRSGKKYQLKYVPISKQGIT